MEKQSDMVDSMSDVVDEETLLKCFLTTNHIILF